MEKIPRLYDAIKTMKEMKKTCLHDRHVALRAQMSPFAGFDMPIQYTGIEEEHRAVREKCGVFDVSHMGEALVTGPDAEKYVNRVFSNDISGAPVGKIFYGMMLRHNGCVIDDLLVYKLGEQEFLLVINAANIDKDLDWLIDIAGRYDVFVRSLCCKLGELAIQGPDAERVMTKSLGIPCSELEFYTFINTDIYESPAIVSRTGYTGEDGFEIYAEDDVIRKIWDRLMETGEAVPCGLGCRDTLRFEAGLPLYGDELSEDVTPLEASLGMFAKLTKPDFIGREALLAQKEQGVRRKTVGLELDGHAIPRHGYEVLDTDGNPVGTVTTGYHSITLGRNLAMALVDARVAALGTPLQIRVRRKLFPAHVVPRRFYTPKYKKTT